MKQYKEPRYKISLKIGYRYLYMIMSFFFFAGMMYFGFLSFTGSRETLLFGLAFTAIFLVFFLVGIYGLTKKCERYEEKVVYSAFFVKREYNLADIAYSKEEIEEFSTGSGDGTLSSSWDKITAFYDRQGKKVFQFGLSYNNVQLLVGDVKRIRKKINKAINFYSL